MVKGKSILLVISILLLGIEYFKYLFLVFNRLQADMILGSSPPWLPFYAVFTLVTGIPILYGLWKFKKWAVFALALSVDIIISTDILGFNSPKEAKIFYYFSLAIAAVAIRKNWKHFS